MKAILRWAWGVEPEEQSLGHEVGKKLFEHVRDLLRKVYGAKLQEELSTDSPFAVTARAFAERTEARLHSEMLPEGDGGGEMILSIPDDENGHKLSVLLKQKDFFSELNLDNDPEVRGWGPRLVNFGAEVERLPDNRTLEQRLSNSGWKIEKTLPEFLKAAKDPWRIAVDRSGEMIIVKAAFTEDLKQQLEREGLLPLVKKLVQIVQ